MTFDPDSRCSSAQAKERQSLCLFRQRIPITQVHEALGVDVFEQQQAENGAGAGIASEQFEGAGQVFEVLPGDVVEILAWGDVEKLDRAQVQRNASRSLARVSAHALLRMWPRIWESEGRAGATVLAGLLGVLLLTPTARIRVAPRWIAGLSVELADCPVTEGLPLNPDGRK